MTLLYEQAQPQLAAKRLIPAPPCDTLAYCAESLFGSGEIQSSWLRGSQEYMPWEPALHEESLFGSGEIQSSWLRGSQVVVRPYRLDP
nr:hypothetical protein CFP56_20628 [Quercus suber]